MLMLRSTTAVASGALLQFRIFGGALGLAIASNVLNNHLRSSLAGLISAEDLAKLLQSTALIRLLPAELQAQVLAAFSDGYNLQMKIMAGFAGAQLLTVGMLWRKNQISVVSENALPEEETANLGEEKVSEDSRPPRLWHCVGQSGILHVLLLNEKYCHYTRQSHLLHHVSTFSFYSNMKIESVLRSSRNAFERSKK